MHFKLSLNTALGQGRKLGFFRGVTPIISFTPCNSPGPPIKHDYVFASIPTITSIHNYQSRSQNRGHQPPPPRYGDNVMVITLWLWRHDNVIISLNIYFRCNQTDALCIEQRYSYLHEVIYNVLQTLFSVEWYFNDFSLICIGRLGQFI